MSERPLSPWRGPPGPLARLWASRGALAAVAVVTVIILGIVGVALSVRSDDARQTENVPAEPGLDAESEPEGRDEDAEVGSP